MICFASELSTNLRNRCNFVKMHFLMLLLKLYKKKTNCLLEHAVVYGHKLFEYYWHNFMMGDMVQTYLSEWTR